MKLDYFIISATITMLLYNIVVQVMHIMPNSSFYFNNCYDGRALTNNEVLFEKGYVLIDIKGKIEKGDISFFLNGKPIYYESLPVYIEVKDEDAIDIFSKKSGIFAVISKKSSNISNIDGSINFRILKGLNSLIRVIMINTIKDEY